jgi:hypothetical protein
MDAKAEKKVAFAGNKPEILYLRGSNLSLF